MTRSSSLPAITPTTVEIVANGQTRRVPVGTTVAGFLAAHAIDPDLVVVERNGEILHRGAFDAVEVQPGDELEIVHFVGGG
jgi:thiamine biosynthesis protein ThiS